MAKFNLIESVKNVLGNITGAGVNIVTEVTEKNMLINTGAQDDGTFLDPAYATIGIPCTEIVPQAVNPNYQSEKAFRQASTYRVKSLLTSEGMIYHSCRFVSND